MTETTKIINTCETQPSIPLCRCCGGVNCECVKCFYCATFTKKEHYANNGFIDHGFIHTCGECAKTTCGACGSVGEPGENCDCVLCLSCNNCCTIDNYEEEGWSWDSVQGLHFCKDCK